MAFYVKSFLNRQYPAGSDLIGSLLFPQPIERQGVLAVSVFNSSYYLAPPFYLSPSHRARLLI